jgi:hypothetical protein
MRPDFTIGQRVASRPGLHWMPVQRFGRVADVNPALIIVQLDGTPHRPHGERKAFLRKNLLPAKTSE